MQYNLNETIQLLKDRLAIVKTSYKTYKEYFKEAISHYDMELANKYHRYMLETNSVVIELEYILNTITGKEN